jgi:hypothetical protein
MLSLLKYLDLNTSRPTNEYDTARLLAIGESSGFSGMLDSIDCMH